MKIIGIVCEYNPFHNGHEKQIRIIRDHFPDATIVSLMSGNYVQRGAPAMIEKSLRAKAAVQCGADLVLELPIPYAISSAEGFAAGAVRILARFCTHLCFGCETGNVQTLMQTAASLLESQFSVYLRRQLDQGLSFPAARAAALAEMGIECDLLTHPNDILAVEYCKAILSQGVSLVPFPIPRAGSYHAKTAEPENPSATAVRALMLANEDIRAFVPQVAADIFSGAPLHSLAFGEKAILMRLRTMHDADFEALPFGSEGLWRKFMHACRRESTLEDIISATKSKRYTRTRIDRMLLCATLDITQEDMDAPVPYTRILAFNDRGRDVIRLEKKNGYFLNIGESSPDPYWELEQRCGALYGLFARECIEPPDKEKTNRIYYFGGHF